MNPGTVTLFANRRWTSGAVLPAGEHAATLISRGTNWVQVRFADGRRATLLSFEGTFTPANYGRTAVEPGAFAAVERPAVSPAQDR